MHHPCTSGLRKGLDMMRFAQTFVRRRLGRGVERGGGYFGNIDGVFEGRIQGWIRQGAGGPPVVVDLFAGDRLLAQGLVANEWRADVAEAGFGDGHAGFSCAFPEFSPATEAPWLPGEKVTLRVRIRGETAAILKHSLKVPGLVTPSGVHLPAVTADQKFDARIEEASESELRGWAADQNDPARIVTVEVLIDGVFYCTARADGSRADLAQNGLSTGHGGLRLPLPLQLMGGGTHLVSLCLPDGQCIDRDVHVTQPTPGRYRYCAIPPILPEDVAVIVPVYNAAEDVATCIDRLAAHTPPGVEILFIDDASPDLAISGLMARAAALPGMRTLRNSTNLGFTSTINRGLDAIGRKHAILLNSDARVTPGWVEGLLAAAASRPKVATVTPMSDRAGAFSAPDPGNDNHLPPGVDEITYARAFRRRALGLYPLVPTGNGFCMFVNRACIDEVGALDAEAFPRGYGEENDFCMRAGRAGWVHLVDDRTYVFHDRSKSFGAAKTDLMRAGRAVVDAHFPEYKQAIRVFSHGAPLAVARMRARLAMADCTDRHGVRPRVLFVVAAQDGGTAQTNLDLMAAVAGACEPWLLRSNGTRLDLMQLRDGALHGIAHHHLAEPIEPIRHASAEYDDVVASWLARHDFATVHIRHLGFHSLNLPRIAKDAGCATVFSFHDFYMLCPSVKLMDAGGTCYGGDLARLEGAVIPELWPTEQMPPADARWIAYWRERAGRALALCDAFVTTSASARDTVLRHLPGIDPARFHVIPHGRDFPAMARLRSVPRHGAPIRILVPGGISVSKGLAVIRDLLAEDRAGLLEFHVLGRTSSEIAIDDPRLIRHGPYQRDEFAARVRGLDIHLGAVFSIWDETWCHTLTELWSVGVPVMVFDFPTVAGRVRDSGAGWVLDHRDIPALYRRILDLALDGEAQDHADAALAVWQRGPGIAQTTALMGGHYLNLYRHVQGLEKLPLVGALGEAPLLALQEDPAGTVLPVALSPEGLLANLRAGTLDGAVIAAGAVPATLIGPLATAFRQGSAAHVVWLDAEGAALDPLRPVLTGADAVIAAEAGLRDGLSGVYRDLRLADAPPDAGLWRGLFTVTEGAAPVSPTREIA